MKSDIENLGPFGRRKIADLVGESSQNSVFPSKDQLATIQDIPFFVREFEATAKYGFSPEIIQSSGLCKSVQLGGLCILERKGCAVNCKSCICGNLAVYGPQTCQGGDGLDRSSIVQRDFDWHSPKEVVEAYSVAYESANGLEKNVRLKYAGVGGYAKVLENSLNGGLVNLVGEHAIDFWGERRRESGH